MEESRRFNDATLRLPLSLKDQAAFELSRWNAALLTRYFPESEDGATVRFAVDDDELQEIQERHGLAQPLQKAVLGVLRDGSNKVADFEMLRDCLSDVDVVAGSPAGPPWYLALLAMQVLAASQMVRDDEFNAIAFWPRFKGLFAMEGLPNDALREWFSGLWGWLSNYLAISCGSQRGRLGLPSDFVNIPYAKKRHVNLPLSQVLVRLADRKPLAELTLIATIFGT